MNSINVFKREFNRALKHKNSYAAIDIKRSSAEIYADSYKYVSVGDLVILFRQGVLVSTVKLSDVDKVIDFKDWRDE